MHRPLNSMIASDCVQLGLAGAVIPRPRAHLLWMNANAFGIKKFASADTQQSPTVPFVSKTVLELSRHRVTSVIFCRSMLPVESRYSAELVVTLLLLHAGSSPRRPSVPREVTLHANTGKWESSQVWPSWNRLYETDLSLPSLWSCTAAAGKRYRVFRSAR